MILNNDMEIEIYRNWYNKTIVQPDGVTQIVDTSVRHTVFQVGMAKNYYGLSSKDEVIDAVIKDLQSAIDELTKMREKAQGKENEEEREEEA